MDNDNNDKSDSQRSGGFWTTLPGILTGIAGVIGAITALVLGLKEAGVIGLKNPIPSPTTSIFPTPKPEGSASNYLITLSNGNLISLEQLYLYLQKQDFQSADKATEILLFKIANFPGNKRRFEKGDSQKIDCQGLKSIDALWQKYSNNKFGLSTQKDMFLDVQAWEKFTENVGWQRDGKFLEERSKLTYNLSAPRGHLPGVLFWISDNSNFYGGISCTF
jgi:GUN4-like